MRFRTIGLAIVGIGLAFAAPAARGETPAGAVAGEITSEACIHKGADADYDAQCGVLYVPENRADPGSRLIALPYRRIKALSEKPGEPLFFFNGGPGSSNMSFRRLISWFIEDRDIVLLGYRGVDGTTQLDCPEVDAEMRSGGEMLSRESLARFSDAYRRCAERLTQSGIDLDGYTILDVVDDAEALRAALGYERIDLMSVSYGTRVAMIYAWRYPDRTFRNAMISVNPPGHFRFDPARLEAQIRRYAALCAADAYCASRTDDLAGDIETALANMPQRWLFLPVNRDAVLFASFMSLFSVNGAASTFDMWMAAADGDYSGMALVSAVAGMMTPSDMLWGDFAAKGLSADLDFDPHADYSRELRPGEHLFGSPGNVLGWAAAGGWPAHKMPGEYRMAAPSDIETLMVSGSLDVSTPAENAKDDLLPLMPTARQVTLAEFSHAGDLLFLEPEASRRLIAGFYLTGDVDDSEFSYRPVDFRPGWKSYPLLAKALLGGAGAIILLFVWLGAFIARRIRR